MNIDFQTTQTMSNYFKGGLYCQPTPSPPNIAICSSKNETDACDVDSSKDEICMHYRRIDDPSPAFPMKCFDKTSLPAEGACESSEATASTKCRVAGMVSNCNRDEQAHMFCLRNLALSSAVKFSFFRSFFILFFFFFSNFCKKFNISFFDPKKQCDEKKRSFKCGFNLSCRQTKNVACYYQGVRGNCVASDAAKVQKKNEIIKILKILSTARRNPRLHVGIDMQQRFSWRFLLC